MTFAPAALVMLLTAAAPEPPEPLETQAPRPLDKASLWLGGFQARSDTTFSARGAMQGQSGVGSVNLEDDLGLDQRQPVSHARLDFLLGQSQGISLEYFGYHRANSQRLSRTFEFDGQVYRADASLRGAFDWDFGSIAHRSWFGDGATVWGLGLGVAYYQVQTRLDARLEVDGEVATARSQSSDDAFAPLLELGWRHAFSDHLRGYADLSGVAKKGDLSGHIVDAAVGLEWFPRGRVGVAVEYGQTRIRIDRASADNGARLDLRLQGPSLFLRLR